MTKVKHSLGKGGIFLCDVLYFIYILYILKDILKDKIVVYERIKKKLFFYIKI